MGILNVTPDSFSDGGRHANVDAVVAHGMQLLADGAEILDIGGESTRPGATPVGTEEELARVLPAVERLRAATDALLSIDTCKPAVARAALAAGADIVNDISGLRDPEMIGVCRAAGCGVVVMHMRGEPRTMQDAPSYRDVVAEVREFFHERLATLTTAGLDPEALCFDPGIGFGKSLDHNLALLRNLGDLAPDNRPMLLGVSRKSFIGKVLGTNKLGCREAPTVALTAWAREAGVRIHRVHDVLPNHQALRMAEAIMQVC